MILVDASIYIDWIQAQKDPILMLRPWLELDRVLSCGVIRCEVLRGIRLSKIHRRMSDLFDVLIEVPTDDIIWKTTAFMAHHLDRQGTVLPLTDLIIASCALQTESLLVTRDDHFRHVPTLRLATMLPALE